MPISVTVTGDSREAIIADFNRVIGGGLPPMQEQPKRDEPAADEQIPRDPPKPRKKADSKTVDAKPEGAGGEQPDLETVRAKLKSLGATDGLGHDKVFEVLGKYDAKNASTVPEGRRAEIIAEIDALIAGVK